MSQATSAFPYPGGKYYIVDWVINHIPDHDCYVEPLAGSASVLLSKPKSRIEVLNDRDNDIVHFFQTLKTHTSELHHWLQNTPYSRELHDKYSTEYYDGYRPDDDVERAGRWYYLRYSQFASKYNGISGFKTSSQTNCASAYANGATKLLEFAERLRPVVIENKDYEDLISIYDSPDTFMYFDPPYVNEGDAIYTGGNFDHQRFVELVSDLESDWLISYTDLPDGLEDLATVVVDRDTNQRMNSQRGVRNSTSRVERLVMNYDPDQVPLVSSGSQMTLTFDAEQRTGGTE